MIAPLDGRAGMVAASSARVYRDTFAQWSEHGARLVAKARAAFLSGQ